MIHIANTHVEFEYAGLSGGFLEKELSKYPLCLQLQYLPLLYAAPEDIVAVTALPEERYLEDLAKQLGCQADDLPSIAQLSEKKLFDGEVCLSWGSSRQVDAWASDRGVLYEAPDWHIAQLVNSKAFSFRYSSLMEAALLNNEQDLTHWCKEISGAKVLKTCFGLAGHGNKVFKEQSPSANLLAFCRREWNQGRPLIGEPWLDRFEDFSTQWQIHRNGRIELIGGTRFEADSRGTYLATAAGAQELLFHNRVDFLNEHCRYVQQALIEISKLGFFGFLGIDAFLYRDGETGGVGLNPLVEINGRQTMSLVALRLQRRLNPEGVLRLGYENESSEEFSLLPTSCRNENGKEVVFRKKLFCQFENKA